MGRLILIRHAKSSWDIPGQSDHDRRLNARGRAAAPLIGRWMAEHGLVPDHGLVSSAVRTRETWDLLCSIWGTVPATEAPELYEAGPEVILRRIRQAPPVPALAVIGHNPGLAETARRLLAQAPSDPDFRKFPTASVAVIGTGSADWSCLDWGMGRLLDFVTPKHILATG
ncbi:MAG TPA: histidine phosphatase family protein [Paracoccaceae bacterium]|nr:histidine phosphatase family protein [Paracoccaceae bacterium]